MVFRLEKIQCEARKIQVKRRFDTAGRAKQEIHRQVRLKYSEKANPVPDILLQGALQNPMGTKRHK